MRALNNLIERLHRSSSFYFMATSFSAYDLTFYLPLALGLVLLPLLCSVTSFHWSARNPVKSSSLVFCPLILWFFLTARPSWIRTILGSLALEIWKATSTNQEIGGFRLLLISLSLFYLLYLNSSLCIFCGSMTAIAIFLKDIHRGLGSFLSNPFFLTILALQLTSSPEQLFSANSFTIVYYVIFPSVLCL